MGTDSLGALAAAVHSCAFRKPLIGGYDVIIDSAALQAANLDLGTVINHGQI
ncbi:MAG: hypothetical protein KA604_04115 [Candidatus Saccharimonas sp.]|nr:hypothetical protein [Candidatus Saccharimonas sp.]